MAEYTRYSTITRTSTITRSGSEGYFTGFSRTGGFVRNRAGTPSTRVSSYARSYFNAQAEISSTEYTTSYLSYYTRNFVTPFTRNYLGYYSRTFGGNYTRSFVGEYTRNYLGYYSRTFGGNYTRNYIAAYVREFTRVRSSSYARDFTGNYVVEYTRTSTRTSAYTRTISGGTGETPTYTPTASNAEYGLVVYGPDGVTEIISPGMKVTNLAHYSSMFISGNSSVDINIPNASDPSKITVIKSSRLPNITMSISGDTVTVSNNYSFPHSVTIIAVRIS
jgi:hypothetical protein